MHSLIKNFQNKKGEKNMKRTWNNPTIEILNISATAGGPVHNDEPDGEWINPVNNYRYLRTGEYSDGSVNDGPPTLIP